VGVQQTIKKAVSVRFDGAKILLFGEIRIILYYLIFGVIVQLHKKGESWIK